MQAKRKSWKEIIDNRRRENFVGRAEYLTLFSENFNLDVPTYLLFSVIGEGGVGKSTLLKQYENFVGGQTIRGIPIVCDENQLSPVAVMGHVAEKLARLDIKHKEFNALYKAYRTHREEIESDPKAPRGAVNLVARGMTEFAIKAAKKTPGVGVLAEYVNEKEASEALSQGVSYLIDRFTNRDEVRLLREPESVLTPLFVELLNVACEKHRIVLMFDVFERTCETLEAWLIEFLNFKYGECDTYLTFVISGRDPIDQHWTELANSICHVSLEPFTTDETRLYLSNRDITDESLVKQIHEDTGGLPVLVELLAGTNPKPGLPLPDISKDAVKRFLQWIPDEEQRRVALLAAVPRQFNLDILSLCLGRNAESLFMWLSTQSYIRTNMIRGWFYHEKVRELMLRYLHNTTPADLEAAHRRLVKYFDEKQKQHLSDKGTTRASETWHRFEVEKVYHLLSEQPNCNLGRAVNAFLSPVRCNCSFEESIPLVFQQVGREIVSQEIREWSQTLTDFYKACESDEHETLLRLANLFAQRNDLDEEAQYSLFARRAETYRVMGLYNEALVDFNRAIQFKQACWAIVKRGQTYEDMGEYKNAVSDFKWVLTFSPGCKLAICSLGTSHRDMGKYSDALAFFDQLIDSKNEDSTYIASRGNTYWLMGKNSQALADFDRAIEIDSEYHWAYEQRGLVLKTLKRYEEALKSLNQAEKITPNCSSCIAWRGEIHRLLGNRDDAIRDLSLAIELEPDDTFSHSRRASVYQAIGDQAAAESDIAHVKQIPPETVQDLYNHAVVCTLIGESAEAVYFLKKAIEKSPSALCYALTDDLFEPLKSIIEFQELMSAPLNLVGSVSNKG